MSTLLEKAKAQTTKNKSVVAHTDEDQLLDLILAYAAKEITSTQAKKAMNYGTSSIHTYFGGILLTAIRHGKVKIVKL